MQTDVEKLTESVGEKYDFSRKTIGVDVDLNQIIEAALRELVDSELDEIESELQRFQGKKYTTLGKADFLKELDEELRGDDTQ